MKYLNILSQSQILVELIISIIGVTFYYHDQKLTYRKILKLTIHFYYTLKGYLRTGISFLKDMP